MLKRLLKTSAIKNVLGGGGGSGGSGGGGSNNVTNNVLNNLGAAALMHATSNGNGIGVVNGNGSSLNGGMGGMHDSPLLRPYMFDFGADLGHHSAPVLPYKKEHLA